MSYEYERTLGFGDNGAQQPIIGERIAIIDTERRSISPVAAAGVLGLIGGLAILALATPFVIGAVSAAATAPEGRKAKAAKWGALTGGLGALVTSSVMYGLTGSQSVSRSLGAVAPIAIGVYFGRRETEALDRVQHPSS